MFKKKVMRVMLAMLIVALLAVLAYAVLATYETFTQMVVEQQQQHLLVVSRAVAKNIELFLSEQLRDIDIMVRTPGFVEEMHRYYAYGNIGGVKEYIISYMLANSKGLSRIYLLDRAGEEIFRYNQFPFLSEFDEAVLELGQMAEDGITSISSVFPMAENHYGVLLCNPIYSGGERLGVIASIVDAEDLYDQFIKPLDARDTDYIIVKGPDGTVLMHPRAEMIGFNYWSDNGDMEGDARLKSMREMLERQQNYEEGTATYTMYSGGMHPPVEEIVGYTRMNHGHTTWLVSTIMPLHYALQPVNENLWKFALLVIAILALLAVALVYVYVLQKNRQKLMMQTHYLRDINHTLEELHQSREQVRHYQKLQTIGALTGGIIHEFNNVLTPIMGYCEFLKEQIGPENEFYEDLDEMYKAGVRAKEIVEHVLPISRKETQETKYHVVGIDAVVKDALKMVRIVLPSSIDLNDRTSPTEANVYGSATQLNQMLLNLCTNAYQAMEPEGGELTVRTQVVPAAHIPKTASPLSEYETYVMIEVHDTGCGMSPEILAKIFDTFFTTKEAGEGTGLGLSLVQNIVQAHNGVIHVDSEVGKGSTFTVYLPITHSPLPESPHKVGRAAEQENPLQVMLVDDEARVLRYLKKRLEKHGVHTDSFQDPEEALARYLETPDQWDVLVMDYTMPQYRGTVLARHIKKVRPNQAILLITGLVEKDALEMKRTDVIDEILIKPLDFDELLKRVRALGRRGAQ